MSERRKDNRGRILRTGESQRKDSIYQYRYTDLRGVRRTVYDSDLKKLREKEEQIRRDAEKGIDYYAGCITVNELIERYVSLKQGPRYNTRVGYAFVQNTVRKEEFGTRQINTIRTSDAKAWMMQLHTVNKFRYSTLTEIRGVLYPAFQMACEEDVISKNPFNFRISDITANDTVSHAVLTPEQLDTWLTFMKNDKTYCKYYDEFVVLANTGMRVSEFCGLTFSDLDFVNRRIRVDHQLVRERGGRYYIEKTKTKAGCRYLPMTDEVYESLQNIIRNRRAVETEPVVDGYTGFILIDKDLHPKVALHLENELRWGRKKYDKLYPDKPLPHITPHVFRHTYCTNMANAGMDIKTLQYLMGHSDVGTTLNIYTHSSYDHAQEELARIRGRLDGQKTADVS